MISLIWLKKTNLSQFFFLELEEVDIKKKGFSYEIFTLN